MLTFLPASMEKNKINTFIICNDSKWGKKLMLPYKAYKYKDEEGEIYVSKCTNMFIICM